MEKTLASMRVANEDCNLKTLSEAKNPLLAKRKKKEAAATAANVTTTTTDVSAATPMAS
jgi:hypothetical protein